MGVWESPEGVNEKPGTIIAIICAIIIVIFSIIYANTSEIIEIHVVKNEISPYFVSKDNIQYRYMVYTENEVFENTDSSLYFKYNSSEFYKNLNKDILIK